MARSARCSWRSMAEAPCGRVGPTIPRRTSCTCIHGSLRARSASSSRIPTKNDMNYVLGSALTGARAANPMGAAPGRPVIIIAPRRGGCASGPRAGGGDGGGGGEGGGPGLTVQGLPIAKPPYGSISAISLDKGEILWQIAHGDTPDGVRNHPALKGLTIPRTGQAGIIGTLVTKTLSSQANRSRRRRATRGARCCARTTRRPARTRARC